MRQLIILGCFLILLGGCGWLGQVRSDYELGLNVALEEGEVSPREKGLALGTLTSGIPYVGFAAALVALGGIYVFTWLRGRQIRKQTLPLNAHPITGKLGNSVGAEAVVQHTANVASGALDVGKEEGTFREGWQYALLSGLGIALAPFLGDLIQQLIPYFQSNHPDWMSGTLLAMFIGLLGAMRNWLATVEPLKKKRT